MGRLGNGKQSFEHFIACFRRTFCCSRHEFEFYGIVLLVVGIVSLSAFVLPIKIWLILVSLIMIYAGYKLFVS